MKFPESGNPEEPFIAFHTPPDDLTPAHLEQIRCWLLEVCKSEGKKANQIHFFFCNDDDLLEVNKKYLNHDFYTDIITFPYVQDPVQADIYISIDRVQDNASHLHEKFQTELLRVMVHGILHLCGYPDITEEEKRLMREVEAHYISQVSL